MSPSRPSRPHVGRGKESRAASRVRAERSIVRQLTTLRATARARPRNQH